MTQMAVTLNLSTVARQRLADQAAAHGQDVSAYASNLLERAVAQPTVDELLAPYRRQVAESGMTDEELDEFHRGLVADVRRERREQRDRAS